MATRLVFIHGRAQERKDSVQLKQDWIASLRRGLAKSGLSLDLDDSEIHFPYYGDALVDRVEGREKLADVIQRGSAAAADGLRAFLRAVVKEIVAEKGISEDEIDAVDESLVVERGILNWGWVQRALVAIDRHVPGASARSIALVTEDVYHYLTTPATAKFIDEGVADALADDQPCVVVAHSLGTLVAYKVMQQLAAGRRWRVPLFVTLGSPLGVTAIRDHLAPVSHPAVAEHWFNAMDEKDVVALYPLTRRHFEIDPEIENKTDVDNFTDNHHGIDGYLEDAVVARRIHEALARV